MKIKTTLLLIISLMISVETLFAQDSTRAQRNQGVIDQLAQDPVLLNDAAAKLLSVLKNNDPKAYDFIRDLNLNFKTFQASDHPVGLGFSYKYDNSWTKLKEADTHDFTNSFNLDLDGNVAFKKIYNPADFLESKFLYNGTFFWGGVAKKNTEEEKKQLIEMVRKYSAALAAGNTDEAKTLLPQINQLSRVSDEYFISLNASAAYESNQDFTNQQFAPGAVLVVGAKAYDPQSSLKWFNLPDYPFALIRWITGNSGGGFTPSGATLPTILFGLDYVVPTSDSLRNAVAGALKPFSRIRFEAAFKTSVVRVSNQTIYFASDYRWYKELNASNAIKAAGIAHFNYFIATLESSNGFFVSYSNGALPFDRKSDNVYGIGFKYNLGNW